MLWTDWELPEPKIEMATLSGDSRTTLFGLWQGDWVFHPTSIILDFSEKRAYWIDALSDTVYSVNYDGHSIQLRFFFKNLKPFDLALYGSTLYWSDLHSHSIERINKTSAEHMQNFGWLSYETVKGIAIMDYSRHPRGM